MRKTVKTRGGVVVQHGLGLHGTNAPAAEHTPKAFAYRAVVVETRVSDSPGITAAFRVECDVILTDSNVFVANVPVLQHGHNIRNVHDLWIPKAASRRVVDPSTPLNLAGSLSKRGTRLPDMAPYDDTDGEIVLVTFVDSSVDRPLIIGGYTPPNTKRVVIAGSGWSEANAGSERGTPQSGERYTSHAGTEQRTNAGGDLLIDTVGASDDDLNETPSTNAGQVRIRVKNSQRFTVEMDGSDVLEVFKDGAQVRIDFGEGATERVILGDAFKTFINNFFSVAFDTHVHPTGVGPSGPPSTAGTTQMQDALLSDLAKVRKT